MVLSPSLGAVVGWPLPAPPQDDGINVLGPIVQDIRVNIGSSGPHECTNLGIHLELSKQR